MAFFKFRKAPANEPARTPPPPESIEALRQRAKYRLVGASVLVLLGVIGFPLLFDKQPRPIAVDTPIEIPDRNKVLPLTLPAPAAKSSADVAMNVPVPVAVVRSSQAVSAPTASKVEAEKKTLPAPEEKGRDAAKAPASDSAKSSIAVASAVPASVASKSKSEPEPAKVPVVSEASKAQSLLEDKPPADAGRFVVQVGAFADAARAHEVRLKLEKAGLKTYTNVADTKDGKRIRVRVGPFASKSEAQKAAQKVKDLKLPAALLSL